MRIVFHCDCNGFYASVAELVNPELKKVPMAVCGDPNSRKGIILAKNELAKKYNIKTAETVWQAQQKCPNLVLAPTYRKLYEEYYYKINEIYESYTDLVERFGIDESFLDVTNSIHLFGQTPVELANNIRERVKRETGLTISIGVSYNKILAKMGSDYQKPDAVTELRQDNFRELLWKLPVGYMYMVGESTQKELEKMYVKTIGELANTERSVLVHRFGKSGELLHDYANGIDHSEVVCYRNAEEVKSVGNGQTYKRNLVTKEDATAAIGSLADTVAARLRKEKLKAQTIQLTIKDTNLKSITRQRQLHNPTFLAKEIADVSKEILWESWQKGKPIRMLTITGLKLVDSNLASEQISLFGGIEKLENKEKRQELEETIDTLREKFGTNTITYGSVVDNDLGL